MNTRIALIALLFVSLVGSGPAPAQTAKPHASRSGSAKTNAKTRKPSATSAKRTSAKNAAARKKQNALTARRARRLNRAFVASADLKPMARQLFEARTRPAYAGVEAYARRHAGTDSGALAYLALGYAHILDHDYAKAVDPLKRAKASAGDLGDYVSYFLASAYGATGQSDAAVATLRDFDNKYPDSLFLRDAMDVYAGALLASNRPAEAVSVLEKYRDPIRSDYELSLGRAYARTGQYDKAAAALRRVYYTMPTAAEAADAKTALDSLSAEAAVAPPTLEERKTRAFLLVQSHHYADAAREYRALLSDPSAASDHSALQVALGVALHKSGGDREARPLLESTTTSSPETEAQRLLALAEMARSADDQARFTDTLSRLRQAAPTSDALEQALLLGGNMYLLQKNYDQAIDQYRELQQRFPAGKRASYAHWKASWLALRQGRRDEAKREFEEQVEKYPASPELPAALYWRARLAEEDGDLTRARAWYQKLADRFSQYYYAELARLRLADLKSNGTLASEPLLEKIPPASLPAGLDAAALVSPPDDNVRVQKSKLLQNGGMTDFAIRELRAAASDGRATWANLQMARFYQENGRYDRALETLKRAVPAYYALDLNSLPRPYWETLFPRPYWTDLKRFASANELDPYLVASLIRQESEFNPGAVSRADALGLMQLLPGTGKKVARDLRLRRFSQDQLLVPNYNLQLGTRYFRTMVNQFGGRVEYALAAYNAGADRVQNWLSEGNFRSTDEFVESIPFTETREYVQAIMRNAAIYKRLYGTP